MAASRVLEAVRRSANGVNVGTRGGVQRSVRVYEREGGEVDPATADRVRRYMCLAIIASPRVFHQAETHMKWLGSVWSASGGGRYAVGWKIIALQQPVVCNSCDRLYQKDFLALLTRSHSQREEELFISPGLSTAIEATAAANKAMSSMRTRKMAKCSERPDRIMFKQIGYIV